MKEYIVTVQRTDQFKIKIDENKIQNVIDNYNDYFVDKLNTKDEIKDLANKIGIMSMNNFDGSFEGLGNIIIDGYPSEDELGYDEDRIVKGIEIETIFTKDMDSNIEEIKK